MHRRHRAPRREERSNYVSISHLAGTCLLRSVHKTQFYTPCRPATAIPNTTRMKQPQTSTSSRAVHRQPSQCRCLNSPYHQTPRNPPPLLRPQPSSLTKQPSMPSKLPQRPLSPPPSPPQTQPAPRLQPPAWHRTQSPKPSANTPRQSVAAPATAPPAPQSTRFPTHPSAQ